MSPVALAAAAGVTDSAIHQLEQGLTKRPAFETALRIAEALGITPYALAGLPEPAADLILKLRDGTVAAVQFKKAGSGDPLSAAATLAEALKGIAEVRATPPAVAIAQMALSSGRSPLREVGAEILQALAAQRHDLEQIHRRLEALEAAPHARTRAG